MANSIILKATGLNTSTNDLTQNEGSLIEASNIIIKRDDVIEQRRGFKLFGESFGSITDIAKQLIVYRNRILRHYGSTLQFQNGTNNDGSTNFDNFNGSYSETETGLRIKSVETNGNLYFTTSDGIKKISARDGNDLSISSGFITQAGGIKALDIVSYLYNTLGNQAGFLPQDSTVAYRALWNTKDLNGNLIQGTPSQRTEIYNPQLSLMLRDFSRLLNSLDELGQNATAGGFETLIDDKNYITSLNLDQNASATELRANLITLATKIDNDIKYADDNTTANNAPLTISSGSIAGTVCTITFTAATLINYFSIGSKIYLAGFTTAGGSINGAQVITAVDDIANTISFTTSATGDVTVPGATIGSNEYRSLTQPTAPSDPASNAELTNIQDYLSAIIVRLQSEPIGVTSSGLMVAYIDPLDITTTSNVQLNVTIPSNVDSNYFIQIYRSATSQATGTTILSDLVPNDEMQLVYEAYPTPAEISARAMTIIDVTPDAFRGANLYTNETTGEGALQANDLPPFAKDIANFKNSTFYSNTKTKHKLLLSLLGVANMITDYGLGTTPKLMITNGSTTNTYSFVTGRQEVTQFVSVVPTNGQYFTIKSANDLRKYAIYYQISGSVDSPPIVTDHTNIRVVLPNSPRLGQVGSRTAETLNTYISDFTVEENILYANDSGTGAFLNISAAAGIGANTARFTFSSGNPSLYFSTNDSITLAGFGLGSSSSTSINVTTTVTAVTSTTLDITVTGVTALDTFAFTTGTIYGYGSVFRVTNVDYGPTTDASAGTTSFTVSVTTQGRGEDASNKQILLSPNASPATAVDETARSLVRVINKNNSETVSAFYVSGPLSVPGQMLLESRTLNDIEFYLLGNNENTGSSFNPDISPNTTVSITAITQANPTEITTSGAHGLVNGDSVLILNSDSNPTVDGFHAITYVSSTKFTIPINVNVSAGTTGVFLRASDSAFSENDDKPNRVYYSKYQQPEAVPTLNYFDVGSKHKAILRIFPLRDSLFVFKEDGLYRISGESAPFTLALFDSTCTLIAPDSLGLTDNLIYCWADHGISSVSEAGVTVVSRPIDVDIFRLASHSYTNFKTATWGLGYDSDNSYIVWTVQQTSDTIAQIAYRYSTLTNSWTTFDKTNNCGIVHPDEDRLYLGAGDTNYIEQERKDFTRYDYADREVTGSLSDNQYFNTVLKLATVNDMDAGDVLVQEQTVTIYDYNMLLKKLDSDVGVVDSNYFSTLEATAGDNMRTKLTALATKLDADTGVSQNTFSTNIGTITKSISSISVANPTVITTSVAHGLVSGRVVTISGSNSNPSIDGIYEVTVTGANTFTIPFEVDVIAGSTGSLTTLVTDFNDQKACYNKIISMLNNDAGVAFTNYMDIDHTTNQEAIILDVDTNTKELTLNLALPLVSGEFTVYKAIRSSFTYARNTLGDPLSFKHAREATMMFKNNAFTNATLSFATDLLPAFEDVEFDRSGNGIFGHSNFGTGFFGGSSNSAPLRTYIPRNCQRCRFLIVKFTHNIARESYTVMGTTITAETGISTRAYR